MLPSSLVYPRPPIPDAPVPCLSVPAPPVPRAMAAAGPSAAPDAVPLNKPGEQLDENQHTCRQIRQNRPKASNRLSSAQSTSLTTEPPETHKFLAGERGSVSWSCTAGTRQTRRAHDRMHHAIPPSRSSLRRARTRKPTRTRAQGDRVMKRIRTRSTMEFSVRRPLPTVQT